jgi:glycosyltransferase involved in cell wall biosynthesis
VYKRQVLILASIFSGFKGKIVISVHENPYTIHSNKTFYEKCILFLCRFIYRYAHGFIAVSTELKKAYETRIKYLPSKRIVIANPILKQINLSKRSLVESNQVINIVSAGRLSYEKNFQFLIHAFSDLPNKAKFRLKIFGEGEFKSQLEALIVELNLSEYIQLEGFSNSLANELRKADLFILTSFWEGFGNVIVEALNEGCQVISSDCQSGPREILENGKWGQLFPVNDKDALVNAIVNFKIKPIPSGLSKHLEKYTYEEVGRQYDTFLRKL